MQQFLCIETSYAVLDNNKYNPYFATSGFYEDLIRNMTAISKFCGSYFWIIVHVQF